MTRDDVVLWLFALGSALAGLGARCGWVLFRVSTEPPEDPRAREAWERRRRWLAISEIMALPAYAVLAVTVGRLRAWPVEGIVLASMVLGALGTAFFLHGIEVLARRRLGLEETPNG